MSHKVSDEGIYFRDLVAVHRKCFVFSVDLCSFGCNTDSFLYRPLLFSNLIHNTENKQCYLIYRLQRELCYKPIFKYLR